MPQLNDTALQAFCCPLVATHVRVLVLVDAVEVEGLVVDEELRAGDFHRADPHRQGVPVLQHFSSGASHLQANLQVWAQVTAAVPL